MVLLLLHNLPNRKKAVEALIKNKIRAGELTEELVKKSLKNHATFIKAEFESVQAIAQMLMTSTERALSQFSMVLFVQVSLNKKVFTKKIFQVSMYLFSKGTRKISAHQNI